MKNVLVTGGSGYFGNLLLEKLRLQGYACASFDINDADDRAPEVRFMQGDIRDLRAVREACRGIDVVFHNVAQVPLARNGHLFKTVNIEGTDNLLKAALENGVSKVVYTSSSAIFGIPQQLPVTEATPAHPGEKYGLAKYQGEILCHDYEKQGLDVSIIRPRTIMGHGRLGIFQILFEWIRSGRNVPVLGSGNNLYQFVHADDLADACIAAALRPGSRIYNCGAADYNSMREVLEHLCRHAATGAKVVSVPMQPAVWGMKLTSALGCSPLAAYHALMYGRSMYFDISRAVTELHWQPKYSNNSMFVESYEWYLRHHSQVLLSQGASHHRSPLRQGVLRLVSWCL